MGLAVVCGSISLVLLLPLLLLAVWLAMVVWRMPDNVLRTVDYSGLGYSIIAETADFRLYQFPNTRRNVVPQVGILFVPGLRQPVSLSDAEAVRSMDDRVRLLHEDSGLPVFLLEHRRARTLADRARQVEAAWEACPSANVVIVTLSLGAHAALLWLKKARSKSWNQRLAGMLLLNPPTAMSDALTRLICPRLPCFGPDVVQRIARANQDDLRPLLAYAVNSGVRCVIVFCEADLCYDAHAWHTWLKHAPQRSENGSVTGVLLQNRHRLRGLEAHTKTIIVDHHDWKPHLLALLSSTGSSSASATAHD